MRNVEVKVSIFYTWNHGDASTWHCGTLEGAQRFVAKKIEDPEVYAYSIEVTEWLPCDENDPDGQLYGGMLYMTFKERGRDF